MTVINVTNATLKGSVTGPTFTGDVDGAKFTGGVTYTDTTPIPPDPTNTNGKITNFSGNNGATIKIDNVDCWVENANKSYSLGNPDPYTLRFEVHKGDAWVNQGSTAPDRSEIDRGSVRFSEGQETTAEFFLKIEAGSRNTAPWLCLNQLHYTESASYGIPYGLEMANGVDKFQVMGRAKNSSGAVIDVLRWIDTATFERGRTYQFKTTYMSSSSNNGKLYVWKDGVKVVNYNGNLGYGPSSQVYWKWGVYRGTAAENLITVVKNIHVT
jgi:polysaccharide lyase-like protein